MPTDNSPRIMDADSLGRIFWLTGLPASGKTTLSYGLHKYLQSLGVSVCLLDGDIVRKELSSDLGYSPADRSENVKRMGDLALALAHAGRYLIVAMISPYRKDRDAIRQAAGSMFFEIYLSACSETCALRDPKGHYSKALQGEISSFTGVSAPYEPPLAPDLILDTGRLSETECLEQLKAFALRACPGSFHGVSSTSLDTKDKREPAGDVAHRQGLATNPAGQTKPTAGRVGLGDQGVESSS